MFTHPLALILILSATVPALAQGPLTQTTRKRQKGPRAIAVIRWQADEKGNGHSVLLPVAVLDEGKVYDASIYHTSPQPMALESGIVYEAQSHGQPLGFFTVGTASHSKAEGGPWIALGQWKTDLPTDAVNKSVQQANVTIGTPKAKSPEMSDVPEGEQRRKTTQVYDESGRPVDDKSSDEPPTLSKNGRREPIERSPRVSTPQPKTPDPAKTTSTDDDPDRPRLKKGAPQPASASASAPASGSPTTSVASAPAAADNDPNRPLLKRGRPNASDKKDDGSADAPIPKEIISRAAVNRPRTYELAAVSDADVSIIPQNYEYRASVAERQQFLRKMEELVDQQLKPKTPETPRPLIRKARPADPSRFADIRFDVLDVDYNNSPELVLTGAYVISVTQRIPFVLVARGDYEGNPRQLLFEKNDRYEFIDAIDLDGDGPGEFLFRRVAPGGSDFVMYRSSPDGLSEIFRGGTAE